MSTFFSQKQQINCTCFNMVGKGDRKIFRSQSYQNNKPGNSQLKQNLLKIQNTHINNNDQGKSKKKSLKKQKNSSPGPSQKYIKQKQQSLKNNSIINEIQSPTLNQNNNKKIEKMIIFDYLDSNNSNSTPPNAYDKLSIIKSQRIKPQQQYSYRLGRGTSHINLQPINYQLENDIQILSKNRSNLYFQQIINKQIINNKQFNNNRNNVKNPNNINVSNFSDYNNGYINNVNNSTQWQTKQYVNINSIQHQTTQIKYLNNNLNNININQQNYQKINKNNVNNVNNVKINKNTHIGNSNHDAYYNNTQYNHSHYSQYSNNNNAPTNYPSSNSINMNSNKQMYNNSTNDLPFQLQKLKLDQKKYNLQFTQKSISFRNNNPSSTTRQKRDKSLQNIKKLQQRNHRMQPRQIQSENDGQSEIQSDQISEVVGRGWDGLTEQQLEIEQLDKINKQQSKNTQTMVTKQSHMKNSEMKTFTDYSNSFISPKSQNNNGGLCSFGGGFHKYGVAGMSYQNIQDLGKKNGSYSKFNV